MITQIDDYFALGCGRCPRFRTEACAARVWAPVLQALRGVCLDAGLEEAVKWGQPCYVHGGRNIAILGALNDEVRLSFFHAALLDDVDGVLRRPGPNTQHPNMMGFTAVSEVTARAPTVRRFLDTLRTCAEDGTRPKSVPRTWVLPDVIATALAADPELAEAWNALTPGRQRSYVILVDGAKQAATKVRRLDKARPKILAGKGANER